MESDVTSDEPWLRKDCVGARFVDIRKCRRVRGPPAAISRCG